MYDKNYFFEYSFIGQGWSYIPGKGLGVNGEGGVKMLAGDQDVAKSIYIILSTAPGERVMRPEFGCGIHDLVFSTPGPQLYGLVAYYVQQALGRWEPRIDVISVDADMDPGYSERLLVDINYRIRQNNNERNLVYPFYTIPRGQD